MFIYDGDNATNWIVWIHCVKRDSLYVSVHGTDKLSVDTRVQITDPGGIKANECHDW